ncbi:hypothetical protein GCM10027416_05960 [Okibacterium endophyticum]
MINTNDADRFGQTVAAQLRAEAAAQNVPVVRLAQRAGINRETLDRWLKGERPLSVPTLYKVARALEIEPSLVVARAEERFASESRPRLSVVADMDTSGEEYDVASVEEVQHSLGLPHAALKGTKKADEDAAE